MARLEPTQIWWSADDLAASGLPEMPGTKRGVNMLATRLNWTQTKGCARRKAGRGGGWQYHWSVLPAAAKAKLLVTPEAPTATTRLDRAEAWLVFDQLPEASKAIAKDRLRAILKIEALRNAGATHVAAVNAVAAAVDTSERTLYNWLAMVEGVAPEDRLAYLVKRNRLAQRTTSNTADTKQFFDHLKSLYMRLEGPTFKECHRKALKIAKAEGWATLTEWTARRRIDKEVPRVTMVFSREGVGGLMRCFPAQIRDRSGMTAMEGVNADCHKIDVFVLWPDGTVDRPQIIAFQDLFSNKILSWRVDHDPNKVMVMSAFGELIENWGIPKHCLFDNGHEFANKWMTAGTATRFRFKVRDDDPLGVLPLMGIQVHWATPAHGQAKPIERGFGDFARDIAKDARFHGAYVGNKPTAKPENYGERAIPAETFIRVLEEGIIDHNARQGRLSATANGRSFDDTFNDSYAKAPIRKATEEQRRLWMMGQHVGHLNRQSGQMRIYNNWYYSPWMSEHPSRRVVARFDPEDLHAGVCIYDVDGSYLGFAECRQKTGFFDVTGAKDTARRNQRIKTAQRKLKEAYAPIPVRELAALLDGVAAAPIATPESKVVKPVFGPRLSGVQMPKRGYQAAVNPEVEAAREALILRMPEKAAPKSKADASGDRFRRAQDILARSDAGQLVGAEEANWVRNYVETAEYQGLLIMFQSHGADGVG